jgi:hypothetical protein
VVFSGQRNEGDPWQIWEMDIDGRRPRQITSDDRGSSLDGSGVTRITHHPGSAFTPNVLPDGRVLFSRGPAPAPSAASQMFTVRYDGTAAQLFYQSPDRLRPRGRAWVTADERVVFVESEVSGEGTRELVAVSQLRPLQSRAVLSDGIDGEIHSVFPVAPGRYLVSYRPYRDSPFALYEFDAEESRLVPLPASDPAFHAVEPVGAEAYPAPKRFESVVDPQKDTGELYCLDADLSSLPVAGGSLSFGPPAPRSTHLRVHTPAGLLREVPLADDGSFYIEIPADTPVHFETVDDDGRIVRGPSAWVWLRPGERRGCIGCHEDRELAPENRVPDAVSLPPVTLAWAADTTLIESDQPGDDRGRKR